jgi:two-component system phosphate regulon sensor histidine kinase PhoR
MEWEHWRLVIVITLAGLLGLLIGEPLACMLVGVLCYAVWLQHQWVKLRFWLQKPKKRRAPSVDGVIDDVCRLIDQMRQQNSSRKKKLTGYLKRFQQATAALPDGIVVLGGYGEVEWANHAARQHLNIRWPKDNGVRIPNLIRDPDFKSLIEDPARLGSTIIIRSPDDDSVLLELKLVSYMGSGRLLIARDITQTVKLQRMRRDFVANVSHELKTPLTVLRGYLETMSPASPAEQWDMALPAMRQQSERMHVLIKDLLVLSQLESGEKPIRRIPTDINKLVMSVVEDAMSLEQYRDQNIQVLFETDKWLVCDVDEMRSAISNLVNNAIKYTPAGSEVTVRWQETEKGLAELLVEDNGEGIAEHHLERLTERFYRVDKGRSVEAGGTGLGLAIVKHVLQRLGAKLQIESEVGKGTRFTCLFPQAVIVEKIDV